MKKRISLYGLILLLLCSLTLSLTFAISKSNISAQALPASTTSTSAVGELWDSANSKFKKAESWQLLKYLFGSNTDFVNYINTNGAMDSGSRVLPATKINSQNGVDATNGLTVVLNGIRWMATSMTISTGGDAVLTLYQADLHATVSEFYTVASTDTKGNNGYSWSDLRLNLLSGSAFTAAYGLFRSGSFATQYLVTPQNITYQQNQTQVGRNNPSGGSYQLPNDSYGAQSSNWYVHTNYQPADMYSNKSGTSYRYDAWKDDYIWIPSATETGMTDRINNNTSIWKLNATQLSFAGTDTTWLRSGRYYWYNSCNMLTPTGAYADNNVNQSHGVRPAIHLNLSKLGALVGTPAISGTYTYNRNSQTISSSGFTNFDTTKIDITGISYSGTLPTGYTAPTYTATSVTFTEAGTYNIKFKVKSSLTPPTYFIDPDSTSTDKDEKTLTLTVKKASLAVPSFGAMPSAYTQTYDGTNKTFTATNYVSTTATATPAYPRNPLSVSFTKDGAAVTPTNTPKNNSTLEVVAKDAGVYEATFAIADSVNYVWADNTTTAKSANFIINKKKLSTPSFGANATAYTQTYDGSDKTFTATGYPNSSVTGYTSDPISTTFTKDGAAITLSNTAKSNSTLEVTVRNAGNYEATFTFTDSNNYEWADGSSGTKTSPFILSPKILALSATTTKTGNAWSWKANDTDSGTITVSGIYAGTDASYPTADAVDLQLNVNGSSHFAGTLSADGSSITFTIDQNISVFGGVYAVGTYTLAPILGAGAGGTHDGNYTLPTGAAGSYTLTISPSGAGLATYPLLYNDGTGAQAMPAGNKLPYKLNAAGTAGVQYTVTLDTISFPSYLSVDTAYSSNGFTNGYKGNTASTVGTHSMQVRLHSNSATYLFANGTQDDDISVTFEIEKSDLNFTNTKWQYTVNGTTGDYAKWNGTTWEYLDKTGAVIAAEIGLAWCNAEYELTLNNLPAGVSVSGAYMGNKKKVLGTYTAECTGITYDTASFNALPANFSELSYKIVPAVIEIKKGSWVYTTQGTAPNTFQLPELSGIAAALSKGIEYEYYDLGTDSAPIAVPGTILTGVGDVTYTAGVTHYYYAKAVVKSGDFTPGTAWSSLISITDSTGGDNYNGTALGVNTKYFETGDNKTIVTVNLTNASVPYTGSAQPAVIAVKSGGLSASDLVITYELNGAPITGEPTDAGVYTVNVALDSAHLSNYVLTGTTTFTYTITPKQVTPITLPTFKGGVKYNGKEVVINESNIASYFDGYDGTTMTVTEANGKDAGSYVITFGIKDTTQYAWDTSTDMSAGVAWNIEKAKVAAKWTKVKGVSVIDVPAEFVGQDLFDYTYTKADGTAVTKEELVKNETYNVSAKLKAGLEANIDFVDESGAVIEGESQPESFEYKPELTLGEKINEFMFTEYAGLLGWVWACIFGAAFLILVIVCFVLIARRNREEAYDDYYDDEYDYDDDDDEEDDDDDY